MINRELYDISVIVNKMDFNYKHLTQAQRRELAINGAYLYIQKKQEKPFDWDFSEHRIAQKLGINSGLIRTYVKKIRDGKL